MERVDSAVVEHVQENVRCSGTEYVQVSQESLLEPWAIAV